MKLTPLYSGSSGNCLLVEHKNTKILVDAGVSGKKIIDGLEQCDAMNKIDALFITHEHSDHISGAGIISRKLDIPIYINEETYLASKSKLGKIKDENIRIINNDTDFDVKDLGIHAFSSSHDSACPVLYRFDDGSKNLAIATDLGVVNDTIHKNLLLCDTVYLEANHDIDMLLNGPYPKALQQRVLGQLGHLSNDACGDFCVELINTKTKNICLGHLSAENNTPITALKTVISILDNNKIKRYYDYEITVARRDNISDTIIV